MMSEGKGWRPRQGPGSPEPAHRAKVGSPQPWEDAEQGRDSIRTFWRQSLQRARESEKVRLEGRSTWETARVVAGTQGMGQAFWYRNQN